MNIKNKQTKSIMILLLLVITLCSLVYGTVIHVPGDYSTIQLGLNNASEGDTVLVESGTYIENIIWPDVDNITLTGENTNECIIDGGSNGVVINCFTSQDERNATIRGFTIQNGSNEDEGVEPGSGTALKFNLFTMNLNNIICIDNDAEDNIIFLNHSIVYMNNVTIMKDTTNHGNIVFCNQGSELEIKNSVLWDNEGDDVVLGEVNSEASVSYSIIQDGWQGDGGHNIDINPQLDENYQPIWNESIKSPCIDTGDPSFTYDADDTRADMGAIPAIAHQYDNWILPDRFTDSGWKWMSLPGIDTLTNDENVAENVLDGFLLSVEENSPLDFVEWHPYPAYNNENLQIDYDIDSWFNNGHVFTSVQGYKFKMQGAEEVNLEVSGFLADPETVIWLNSEPPSRNESWIGYFLEESQSPYDAIPENILENLSMIKTQHWYKVKIGDQWVHVGPCDPGINIPCQTFNYGDMVILYVKRDYTGDDLSFTWQTPTAPPPRFEPEGLDHFTYEENSDYYPIVVEDIEDVESIDEIGIFVDERCLGAEKVYDLPIQLRAYPEGDELIEDLQFEVVRDGMGRTSGENIDKEVYHISSTQREDGYILVSLAKSDDINPNLPTEFRLLPAYPNPFNPITVIGYQLKDDCDISIDIYNVNGQLVETLIDKHQELGYYDIQWNADGYASGVYFVKLQAGEFTETQKLVLLK